MDLQGALPPETLSRSAQPAGIKFQTNCGVCGEALVYATEPARIRCSYCGQTSDARIYCPHGHFVCDACHQVGAIEVLLEVLHTTTSTCPVEILEQVMAHPSIPMHGPEHHAIVPGAIVTAARNAGYSVPEGAVEEAVQRGAKVPGGWCGLYGACGAGVGVGVAVSVLTGATPLKGKPRRLANQATSYALGKMANHDDPRCCKRATRRAMKAAVEFLKDRLDIELKMGPIVQCQHFRRNQECVEAGCGYFPKRAAQPVES